MISAQCKVADKELQKAFKAALDASRGKRKFPPALDLQRYKRRYLKEPWQKKGINEAGAGNQWEPNARSTALQKFGKEIRQEWVRVGGEVGPMTKDFMRGGGAMRKKQVSMRHRTEKLMVRTGALRRQMTVGWTPKRMEFAIFPVGSSSRYAYFHLHGVSGRTGRAKRRRFKRVNGKWEFSHYEYYTFRLSYPARPWAVWKKRDQEYLARRLEKWAAKAL